MQKKRIEWNKKELSAIRATLRRWRLIVKKFEDGWRLEFDNGWGEFRWMKRGIKGALLIFGTEECELCQLVETKEGLGCHKCPYYRHFGECCFDTKRGHHGMFIANPTKRKAQAIVHIAEWALE